MAWAPDYVTVAEARTYLGIGDTADDDQLALAVTSASRAIDTACRRQFGKTDTPEERVYGAVYDRHEGIYEITIDDLATTTGLVIADQDGTSVTSYTLYPRNAASTRRPYERLAVPGDGVYTVTGVWGWSATPTAVMLATLLQTSRFHARRTSPFGIAGSPDQGSEIRLLARVDPDVDVVLGPYRRRWWAA